MTTVDPITREIIRNGLSSIADEMALTVFRTTYSAVLKDNMDYSTGFADGEGRLALRVTPGARSEAVEIGQGKVLVKVRVKPEDGKANQAVLELLARALGIATSRLRMLRGATGREKLVQIES